MDDFPDFLDRQVAELFDRAQAAFGSAIRTFWMHEFPGCPGCGGELNLLEIDGEQVFSLNAFFYRPEAVLIGYALCGSCAAKVLKAGAQWPPRLTPLHARIEKNLIEAYHSTLRSEGGPGSGPLHMPDRRGTEH